MKVLAAIVSGILAAAIGITSTYFVMTKGLGYYQETKTSIYEEGDAAKKGDGKKGMRGMPGGKGMGGKEEKQGNGKNGPPSGT